MHALECGVLRPAVRRQGKPEDPVELVGALDGVGGRVPVPVAHARHFLGELEAPLDHQ